MKKLNEIKHYIVNKYPDSCIATNYGNEEFKKDDRELLVSELNNFFWYEHMKLCGCGNPEKCQEIIKEYLAIIKRSNESNLEYDSAYSKKEEDLEKVFGVKDILENPLLLFLTYSLDAYGFTDHGSGIGSAWITDFGEMYLYVLNEKFK